MIETIFQTLKTHEQLFWLLGLGSFVLLVGTALLIPWLIILLPVDFFARIPARSFSGRHPVVAFLLIVLRNVVGAALLLAGIIMLFIPGQGLLTILIAIALIDFPGKHSLLLKMTSNPRMLNAANGIRRWAGKPEFPPARSDFNSGEPSMPPERGVDESFRND
ncbi:MAG TPA: PGPGW domain-containing protein [Gammaproteobacteria bacterium]|nr:PGPGW domain-containing protein [Gammaproteobacteria bacterium]